MSDSAHNPDDYCYRHPDRLSFVLCERCGRTICLECQNHVDGRVLCPDDAQARVTQISEAREAHARADRRTRARTRTRSSRLPSRFATAIDHDTPIVTYTLMVLIGVLWIADIVAGGALQIYLEFYPSSLGGAVGAGGFPGSGPWTLLTSMVSTPGANNGFISVVFNLFSLFVIGRILERHVGRAKYLLMYVLSGLGASVFALLFGGVVLSASSAIFGLVAAFIILLRKSGTNLIFLYASVALNILSIALSDARAFLWQGAIGGLLVGAAVGYAYLTDDGTPDKSRRSRLILGGIAGALVVLAIVKYVV